MVNDDQVIHNVYSESTAHVNLQHVRFLGRRITATEHNLRWNSVLQSVTCSFLRLKTVQSHFCSVTATRVEQLALEYNHVELAVSEKKM